ncbi:TetR family transcriptional regulator [Rhizobium sp. AC44/96]|uniref:TetR/AcrR family transcriptional regulator n=1 Tax=Rhizobium sp. AC44/96 TaxID=1841654 RepID=UPI00080FC5EA|nr:helix-turn-helix domain-containing protein [Rhizobium sp. AC44/96]OCJ16279.1 TetR family transcriptional regulator [Rhizobium sp. AC44/96]
MIKTAHGKQRREDSLSRDRIVETAIALLDSSGEGALTFKALSERLETGAGAIYWHIDNKNDLLIAACDAVVARTLGAQPENAVPEAAIQALALDMFDAIDAHPWVGATLARAAGQLPTVRILERIGQQVRALGVPDHAQWAAVSALLSYILGVSGQNAANAQLAQARNLDRSDFLGEMSSAWSRLDPVEYPFTQSVAAQLPDHDDRGDFLAGIDFILRGIIASRSC